MPLRLQTVPAGNVNVCSSPMAHLLGTGGSRRLWQSDLAINVVKANQKSMLARDLDQLSSNVRRQGLPALVVANIALRASKLSRNGLLRQTKALTDGL